VRLASWGRQTGSKKSLEAPSAKPRDTFAGWRIWRDSKCVLLEDLVSERKTKRYKREKKLEEEKREMTEDGFWGFRKRNQTAH